MNEIEPADLRKITKPLAFQKLGPPVYSDKEPSSHRAQRPWGIICDRESRDMVRDLMKNVIEPHVLRLREHVISAKNRPKRSVEDLRKPVLFVAQPGG